MIDHERKCIFVHIPKTAGESVETAFMGAPLNEGAVGRFDKHWSIAEIREHDPDAYRNYYKFSIVRNPWDRYISTVLHRRRLWGVSSELPTQVRDDLTLGIFKHRCASNMLCIDGELAVDHVVRFEDLDRGMAAVWEALGTPPVELPRANISEGRQPYWAYYDRYAMSFIRHSQRRDIERFGYEFEGALLEASDDRLIDLRARAAAGWSAYDGPLRPGWWNLRGRMKYHAKRLIG